MYIYINDQCMTLPDNSTLSDLLRTCKPIDGPFAVALNQVFIPKHAYDTTFLIDNDRVDHIIPMQGG